MCFFWWLCCSFQLCIDIDLCVWMLPKFQTLISRQQTWFALCEVSSNPITLVHIGLVSRICIFVIHVKEYSFLYMENISSVFLWVPRYQLVIVTTRSNLSYYWICDTSIIRPFYRFPNVSYWRGRIVVGNSFIWHPQIYNQTF
jgi:hypothetical protein